MKSFLKSRAIAAFLCAIVAAASFFPACTSGGGLTPQAAQAVISADDLAQTAVAAYAKQHPGGNTALVSAGLSGLAQLAQAYVGRTPAQANLAAGAGVPAVGPAVQSALPSGPITQAQVDNLYQAAALVSAP